MNEDQFERETLYQASMSFFLAMFKDGRITEKQYAEIDVEMQRKYKPLIGKFMPKNA